MDRPEPTYPFVYLATRGVGERPLYAPFWRVKGEVFWKTDQVEKARGYGRAKPLGALFFPAFWTPRTGHDENLTLRYGLLDAAPREAPEAEGPLLPGILDPGHLPEMARLTWMAYLDRLADVTGVEVTFRPDVVTYVAVPFLARGAFWEDGVLGLRFPSTYFGRGLA